MVFRSAVLRAPKGQLALDAEERPVALDALELVTAAVREAEAGAGYEVVDGSGDKDLARGRQGLYAGGEVHGDPGYVGAGDLALAGCVARRGSRGRVA